jgi:glycosyltransferase involved in cell wall biosynthesis
VQAPTQAAVERGVKELTGWLRRELSAWSIRVVHAHNLHYFTPIPALALNELQPELNLSLHHTYHSVWGDRLDIAKACAAWPGQYAWSNYVQEFCRRYLEVFPEHTRPGIIVDRFDSPRPPHADGDERVILHPARLVSDKGADISVRILHQLLASGLRARLILTDTSNIVDWNDEHAAYRKTVEALISELGVDRFVEFQEMAFADMPYLYEHCDLVVYPSRYAEPLGLVPLEAGAAGRPVIVTSLGGLPETVADGETGYVVAPDDLDALVTRARLLLSDQKQAWKMADAARAHVELNFNLADYLDEMVGLYRQALAATE